jgi:hypothetical protein
MPAVGVLANGQSRPHGRTEPSLRALCLRKLPYAIDRYIRETGRLYRVLDRRLADRPYIVDDYSIADIASYPWVQPERQGQDIDEFPHLKRWKAEIRALRAARLRDAKRSMRSPSSATTKPVGIVRPEQGHGEVATGRAPRARAHGEFRTLKNYMLYCLDRFIEQYGLDRPFLEIGCGRGDVSAHLARRDWRGVAIDFPIARFARRSEPRAVSRRRCA